MISSQNTTSHLSKPKEAIGCRTTPRGVRTYSQCCWNACRCFREIFRCFQADATRGARELFESPHHTTMRQGYLTDLSITDAKLQQLCDRKLTNHQRSLKNPHLGHSTRARNPPNNHPELCQNEAGPTSNLQVPGPHASLHPCMHASLYHLEDQVGVGGAGEVQAGQHKVGHGLQRRGQRHRFTRPGRSAEDERLVGSQPRLQHLHVPSLEQTDRWEMSESNGIDSERRKESLTFERKMPKQ